MDSIEKQCLNCQKPLRGRADKKFCDDYCRNNFNNKQSSDKSQQVRAINTILLKNRRILAAILGVEESMKKCSRQRLTDEGFNFKYFTHQFQNKNGQVYFFVYEYGYLPLENEWLLLVKREEGRGG